jgi:hypothetical protein
MQHSAVLTLRNDVLTTVINGKNTLGVIEVVIN